MYNACVYVHCYIIASYSIIWIIQNTSQLRSLGCFPSLHSLLYKVFQQTNFKYVCAFIPVLLHLQDKYPEVSLLDEMIHLLVNFLLYYSRLLLYKIVEFFFTNTNPQIQKFSLPCLLVSDIITF